MTESISPIPLLPTTPPASARGQRIKGLDVLRGLAACAVLVFHYTGNYQRLFGHARGKPWFSLPYGAMGVQLFFVISGFVIFMTLEKTRRPADFVRSRFSRLYPAYWAAVILTFVVLTRFPLPNVPGVNYHKYHFSLSRGILNLTMCQEMFGVGHLDAVYWTLQLELCFYLLMFILFATRQLARIEWYLLGVLAISEGLNWLFPASSHLLMHHHALAIFISDLKLLTVCSLEPEPHCHLHVFIIGIVLFKLSRRFDVRQLLVLGICLGYSYWREWGEHGTDFLMTVAFTAVVYIAARGWLSVLENRVLLFFGAISYSLYLTHQDIGYVIIHALEHRGVNSNIAIFIAAAAAILIATALTYGIEQPALKLLRPKKNAGGHADRSSTAPAQPPSRKIELPTVSTAAQS